MTTSGPASGVPSPSPVREDVEIESDGALLAAWFYPAHTTQPSAPCVVMGHGFSMTRADGLEEYAERTGLPTARPRPRPTGAVK